MVEHQSARFDGIFGALADPTRRAMIETLSAGPAAIGELSRPFEMSFAAASKHVRVLERAGLVRREIRGRRHYCSLERAPLAHATAWLERYARFWSERLDELERVVGGEPDDR